MIRKLLPVLLFAVVLCACGGPEPTAETRSAFQCDHFSSFTHLCTDWEPSLIPGSPINYVPLGDPVWCPQNTAPASLLPGWTQVFNDRPTTGRYCARMPPGNYGALGDWDYDSTIASVPSVHVRAIMTGPQSYLFAWDGPGFSGNFVGFYPPGSVVSFDSTVRSFSVVLGQ